MSELSAAERLARRYPKSRVPRRAWIPLALLLAIVGGAWLVWSAWVGSHPPVVAQVTAFNVVSDIQVDAKVTVQRTDPQQPATCTVIAKAVSYDTVGQLPVAVPASANELEHLEVSLRTIKRATTVTVEGCVLDQ